VFVMKRQTFTPQVVQMFIALLKPFARRRFPEPRRTSNRGRPRCGERWVLVLLCLYAKSVNTRWRDIPEKLSLCDFLLEQNLLAYIPSKSTFHRVWQDTPVSSIESLIRSIGYKVAIIGGDIAFAVDSSGFKIIVGCIWRLLKWEVKKLTKTASIFKKVHIGVSLPSRAIVTITTTLSTTHDSVASGILFKNLSKRLLKKYKRMYGDSAYWSENILGWLAQEGVVPVIPPKANSKDHGTNSPQDLIVRAHTHYIGLYTRNFHPEFRAGVEHVFGCVKLDDLRIFDRKPSNQIKTLLTPFLWYNFELYERNLSSVLL